MLPALLRRTTGLPPPLTVPFMWSPPILPTTVTASSLLTPPAEVAASRSNPEFSATRTVTPPPEVESLTSSVKGDGKTAEIEPPEVEPPTLPATFSMVMPPPLVSTCAAPRKSFTTTEPPEVSPFSVPEPPATSMPPPLVCTFSAPSQSATRMPPPEVSPSSGPRRRVNFSPPPLVPAFISPARSLTAIPPPEVLSRVLNRAGTVRVYFPSVRWEPRHESGPFFCRRERMVTVSPSCEKVTGRSRRNSSSSDLFLRLTFRNTSTITSLVALVLTSMDPKSTSTTTLPPVWTAKRLLIRSSVSAQAARQPANRSREYSFILNSAVCWFVDNSVLHCKGAIGSGGMARPHRFQAFSNSRWCCSAHSSTM